MAKQPQVICKYCNKKFYREDEEFVKDGRRYIHKQCAELYKNIHNLMKEKCQDSYVKTKIDSQIIQFTKDGYELQDIWETINWWFGIRQEDPTKANGGIGIFPHVYNDYLAEKRKKDNIRSITQNQKISDFIDKPRKAITVSKKYIQKPKRVQLFDLQ